MRRRGAVLAWTIFAISATQGVALLALASANGTLSATVAFSLVTLTALVTVGAIVASRLPRNPIGWLLLGSGTLLAFGGVGGFGERLALFAVSVDPGTRPVATFVAWLASWTKIVAFGPIVTFLLLLFPDGRLLGPRWRSVAWASAITIAFGALSIALAPGPLPSPDEGLGTVAAVNPFASDSAIVPALYVVSSAALFFCVVLCIGSAVVRFRRSEGVEREQLKWFAYAAAFIPIVAVIGVLVALTQPPAVANAAGNVLYPLSAVGIPIATGIAILRYRLYEIDVLINRTLVYGGLTAILAGLYTASIGLFQKAFISLTGERSDTALVLSVFLIATAFTPIKNALQTAVDRRFRDAAGLEKRLDVFGAEVRAVVGVLDSGRLTARLADEAKAMSGALSATVYLRRDGEVRVVETRGEPSAEPQVRVPLRSDGREIGELVLGPRRGGADYTNVERDALQRVADVVADALVLAAQR